METPENEIYRTRITLVKMMKKRNFECLDIISSFDDFKKEYLGRISENNWDKKYYVSFENDEKKIYAVWVDENVGNSVIGQIKIKMQLFEIEHCILIAKNKITSYAKTIIKSLVCQGFRIETFKQNFLKIDITEHILVPTHIICSEEEKKLVIQQYNLKTNSQYPTILITDSVVKYLGAKRGQLIKIIRKSDSIPDMKIMSSPGTSEKKKEFFDVTYRLVL